MRKSAKGERHSKVAHSIASAGVYPDPFMTPSFQTHRTSAGVEAATRRQKNLESVSWQSYYYRLLSGTESLSTFERDRAWHVPEELNLQTMQEACKVLIGKHDFSSFRAAGCQANSPVRTLDEIQVFEAASVPHFPSSTVVTVNAFTDIAKETSDGYCLGFGMRKAPRCLVVKARARSFLYHQVRLLVGALKCVGTGQLTVSDVERILNAKDVTAASPMAPACGLYLGHVKYDLD